MSESAFWAVVPAAGAGLRLGGPVPKQYLEVRGRMVIEHTLDRLLGHPRIAGAVVVLSAADGRWDGVRLRAGREPLRTEGGAERCDSVLNGLEALAGRVAGDDWVLVHDAARPCLRAADLDRLMDAAVGHPAGAILGLPIRDTVKRGDAAGEILETVDRGGLWRALTPQMFRVRPLADALRAARAAGVSVTDEAQAMELAGAAPLLVEGAPDNVKVTRKADLALAARYLEAQEQER